MSSSYVQIRHSTYSFWSQHRLAPVWHGRIELSTREYTSETEGFCKLWGADNATRDPNIGHPLIRAGILGGNINVLMNNLSVSLFFWEWEFV